MATKTATPKVTSVGPERPMADDLLDQLVAFRPIEERELETRLGTGTATIAQIVVITATGEVEDLGERPVFWTVVREQLAAGVKSSPWVAGRLVRAGQAYKLAPLTDAETAAVVKALAAVG